MSEDPRPSASAATFYVDDCCLVYDETKTRLYRMNSTSGLIWTLLDEGCGRAGLLREAQQIYGLSPAGAEQLVDECLADWRDKGLLGCGSAPDSPDAPSPRATSPTVRDVPGAHCYRLLDRTIRVEPGVAELAETYHPVLAHLEVENATPDCIVEVQPVTEGRIEIVSDGLRLSEIKRHELAPFMKGLVWSSALNQSDDVIGFHAGVVAAGAGAILMPGPPGSGKSTLTASLIARGYGYLSDEIAVLTRRFTVLPVPLALCVKSTGRDALRDIYRNLDALPLFDRSDGKSVSYLPPPAAGDEDPVGIGGLVFPTYDPRTPTHMSRIAASECIHRLMSQCMVVRGRIPADDMRRLLERLTRIPAYSLIFNDRDTAVDLICEAFPAAPRPVHPDGTNA